MALVERPEGGIDRFTPVPKRVRPPRATLDIRLPWPLARAAIVFGLVGMTVFGVGAKTFGYTHYQGQLKLLVLKLNDPRPSRGIEITDRRVTAISAIARSQPFLIELQRESGVDLAIEDLQGMVEATRPNLGAITLITVTGSDRRVVERLTAHLSTAMSEIVDRLRSGSLTLTESNGLNVSVGDDPDYRGPLYLELFTDPSGGRRAEISQSEPRLILNIFVGLMLSMLVMASVGALAHERLRATDREDLEQLLDLDNLGGVPRPDRRKPDGSARALLGFANSLAALSSNAPHIVAVGGAGTRRIRARFSRSLAHASAAVTGRGVVMVDLDPTRLSPLRRRPGLLDVVADPDVAGDAFRPMARWGLPRWARRLGGDLPVRVVGAGDPRVAGTDADEWLASAIASLAVEHVVILNLPEAPGPLPLGSAMAAADVGVVVVVDGWTVVDDARAVADWFEAAAGIVGFALMEN